MSRAYDPPRLTPQFCFNQTALRDFLRLSRSTIDDSITQNLNSLLTPSSKPWDPTNLETTPRVPPASKRIIPSENGKRFKEEVLFPSWQSRSDILNYCASVATSPDPSDPDSVLRQVEDTAASERVVDERLDPYSGRYFPREARTEGLASLIRSERMVEDIVRRRSWGVVKERCAESSGDYTDALDEWRKETVEEEGRNEMRLGRALTEVEKHIEQEWMRNQQRLKRAYAEAERRRRNDEA